MEQPKSSFSSIVKAELLQVKVKKKDLLKVELTAFVNLCGILSLNKGISIEVDKPAYAKRVFSHIKTLYGIGPRIHLKQFNKLGRNYKYFLRIDDREVAYNILCDTGYIDDDGFAFNYHIKKHVIQDDRCKQSFLRVVFLNCGSISNPEKHYHLEFVLSNDVFATDLMQVLNNMGLNAKMVERKKSFVVYLKDAENIVDFLTYIGATNSITDFYNIKIIKEMRNNVNRTVNCETANINKTVNAATRQINSINKIDRLKGLNSLSDELVAAAKIRLQYPDVSLNELVELCDFEISKSGLNHRFKKIDKIASELIE